MENRIFLKKGGANLEFMLWVEWNFVAKNSLNNRFLFSWCGKLALGTIATHDPNVSDVNN